MNTFGERLDFLLKELGHKSARSFDRAIDASDNQTNHIIGAKAIIPNAVYLAKVKAAYGNVNLNWLVSGEGDAFTPEPESKNFRDEIERLREENNLLRNELKGSRFALSLIGQNTTLQIPSNFNFVGKNTPVKRQDIVFFKSVAHSFAHTGS